MTQLINIEDKIQNKIHTIRGIQVMLDSDLASLYGVETKILNQAVKRNIERFDEDFMFEITENDIINLKSQFVTSSWGGRRNLPKVFTEQGVYMLATVLKSKSAIEVTKQIMRVFTKMRKFLLSNAAIFQRIDNIEAYHIGSSLKDLGKKIFGFSKIDYTLLENVLNKYL